MGPVLSVEAQPWYEKAACLDKDADAFFPEKGGSTRAAKRICATCSVTAECLDYALDNDERFGMSTEGSRNVSAEHSRSAGLPGPHDRLDLRKVAPARRASPGAWPPPTRRRWRG